MKQVILETKKRETSGKSAAKKSRKNGFVPAVVYGKETDALNIEIPERDFSKGLSRHGMNTLFSIKIGSETHTAMVSEVQRAPLTKEIFHVDFHKIALDAMITTTVPVKLEGESKGVKSGGILEQLLWNIEIEVLPLEIPECIMVDITGLDINQEFRVKDLKVKGFKITSPMEDLVVAVHSQTEEEESTDIFAEPSAEPEVIKKGKEDKE